MKKKLLVITLILGLAVTAAIRPNAEESNQQAKTVHDYMQLIFEAHRELDTNAIFLPASRCKGCHGKDPLGIANVTMAGIDINLFDDWETSMMGLAGVDPLWKAKVRHEIMVNPGNADELQDLCTSCHAPMGHYNAFYRNQGHYTLEDLAQDSLGQSGVSCLGCHAMGWEGLGERFTGDIPYDTTRKAYGPFPGPMAGPMQLYINFTPVYSPHVSEGRFCSPCHTLISNTVDLDGNPTGATFVEQATFHEWKNSAYPEENIQCQTCHMPKIDDPVKIAVGYTGLPGRSPFNLHTFSGANSFMVNLIKQNKAALGVTATDANFDSTLSEITRLLRTQTVDVTLGTPEFVSDSMVFPISILNKAGHKFPSGYPARRAFVSFVISAENGDTLFSSGVPTASGFIKDLPAGVHPHHQVITSPNQAQVYEMIMGDVNGNITTVLERGAVHLKDNRIPPLGFSTTHQVYDTVAIVGEANSDPDFNRNGNFEGSGADIVYYKVPMSLLNDRVNISARVYYQSVPPHWLDEMRMFNAPEIESFLGMYDAADKAAIMLVEDTLEQVLIPLKSAWAGKDKAPEIFPNPATGNDLVQLFYSGKITSLAVYTLSGQRVSSSFSKNGMSSWKLEMPQAAGVYLVRIQAGNVSYTRKFIRRNN